MPPSTPKRRPRKAVLKDQNILIRVTAEQHDFLGSDADLEALVKRIEASMPQPMLPFAFGAP